MKTYIFKQQYQWLLVVMAAVMTLSLQSCKDDEEGMGTPVITAVRSCDPAKADSTFTNAGTGSLIAIIGQNLSHVQKVYINDQPVYFNPTMNTDHSVVVTVPSEKDGFELTAFNSDLKDEIRVETSHGTATYAFKITAPWPSISRIQGTYPRLAGNVLDVYGLNLVDIEKVYFTDLTAEQLDTTVWETIGGTHVEASKVETVVIEHYQNSRTQAFETTSQLAVTIPDLPFEKGTLVIETAAGTTYIGFTKNPGQPIIFDISSDMPVPGEEVVITGREFVQVESVRFGDITLTPKQFTVSASEDAITFVMPQVPADGGNGLLTVVTPGGEGSALFWNLSGCFARFDDDATDNGWGPNASYETANGDDPPYTGDGKMAHFFLEEEGQSWWGQMIYFRKDWDGNKFPMPSYDIIPADASTDDIYLAMEIFNNESNFNDGVFTGYLRYFLQYDSEDPVPENDDSGNPNPVETVNQYDTFKWLDYGAGTFTHDRPVLADINGEAPVGKWYRHVVPLSKFGKYRGKDYRFVVENGINQFRIQFINQGTARGNVDVYVDNVRIFYKKK
ncbi:MAG: IPT/TIG domain-containing protein [Prevotella sp.]|nr:IPT/TIG domain-containing protein [Prevotella sp.]